MPPTIRCLVRPIALRYEQAPTQNACRNDRIRYCFRLITVGRFYVTVPLPLFRLCRLPPTDEFVVMACDGIWDVMGNDEACLFLRKCIQEGDKNLGHMLEQIEVGVAQLHSENPLILRYSSFTM